MTTRSLAMTFFNFVQAGTEASQVEADDGRNSTKKIARAPTSAVEYTEQTDEVLYVCVHGRHVPSILVAKERQKCVTHEYAA